MSNTTEQWYYYNHALLPTAPPNRDPDVGAFDKTFWRAHKGALLARWTTDFDCGEETNWWYVVKTEPFELASAKKSRRTEINKGLRNFDVRVIDPLEYKDELTAVTLDSFTAYPAKYRPSVDPDEFRAGIGQWTQYTVFGAFFKETGELCGYAYCKEFDDSFVEFLVLKTRPAFERYKLNAALVYARLMHYEAFLQRGGVISAGARNIQHETGYQSYICDLAGFRKAYCRLHVVYNPRIRWAVRLLFPFRGLLRRLDGIGFVHKINGVLTMEEIVRSKERKKK